MSTETATVLNTLQLVGYGKNPWWNDEALRAKLGSESPLYPGPIPREDIVRRLFAWQAEPAALLAMSSAGMTDVTGWVANVRNDTGAVLGIVSESYAIHQYEATLLDGTANIIGDGLGYASAGLLKGGARAYVSVSTSEIVSTAEGVDFLPYLAAYTSHDGSWHSGYKACVTLVVCDNTAAIMQAERHGPGAADAKIRHSRLSVPRLASAQDALSRIYQTADAFSAQIKTLCETAVTDAQWRAIVDELAPAPDKDASARAATLGHAKRDELFRLARYDLRCAPWYGTAFGAVQTVSTYVQHAQTVRGAERSERNVISTIDGTFDKVDAATLATVGRVLARV